MFIDSRMNSFYYEMKNCSKIDHLGIVYNLKPLDTVYNLLVKGMHSFDRLNQVYDVRNICMSNSVVG